MAVFDCAAGEQREHSPDELAAIAAIPGSEEQVICERERRLARGFDFDFGGDRGVHRIGTTEQDLKGWDEVTKGAQAEIALGNPDAYFGIVTDTGPAIITAIEWMQVLAAATAFRQPIWQASFVLQAMEEIPGDLADDAHWPPVPS